MVWSVLKRPNHLKYLKATTCNKINLFLTNVPTLHPLKTTKNLWFSDVFRGYKMGTLATNELSRSIFEYFRRNITTQKISENNLLCMYFFTYDNTRHNTRYILITLDKTLDTHLWQHSILLYLNLCRFYE